MLYFKVLNATDIDLEMKRINAHANLLVEDLEGGLMPLYICHCVSPSTCVEIYLIGLMEVQEVLYSCIRPFCTGILSNKQIFWVHL